MSPADAIRPACHFSSCSIPNTHYHQTGGVMAAHTAQIHKHESRRKGGISSLSAAAPAWRPARFSSASSQPHGEAPLRPIGTAVPRNGTPGGRQQNPCRQLSSGRILSNRDRREAPQKCRAGWDFRLEQLNAWLRSEALGLPAIAAMGQKADRHKCCLQNSCPELPPTPALARRLNAVSIT